MNPMFYQNQESIILKSRDVIKSFDLFNEILILGTEKGGCEIFDWKAEKQIKMFNFYYKENTKFNICEFLKEKELSENCLQIINIGIITSLTEITNRNNVYFYAQSRKGDFFICSFEKICSQNLENKIEFLYKIESNVETFCKFVFCEFTQFANNKITTFVKEDIFSFSVFMPSDKENVLNVFDLQIPNNFNTNSNDKGISCYPILGESKAFNIADNKFLEETKNIEKLLEDKEELIKDFEEKTCNDDKNLDDPIKFYSDNGLISSMDKSEDKKYLILGTENLSVLVLYINSGYYLHKKEKQNLIILDNFNFSKTFDNKKAVTSAEVNSIITLKIINNFSKESQNNYKILVGMYSSTIKILNFNSSNNKIEFNSEIKNACSIHKPGISTFDFIHFEAKITNDLEEMELGLLEEENKLEDSNVESIFCPKTAMKKVNFLCTGGYDYKIRLYEFEDNKDQIFKYLGALYNGANNIVHKVQFVLEKGKNNQEEQKDLYLFVASDKKLLNIYNIA